MRLRLKTNVFDDKSRDQQYEGPDEFDIDDAVAEEYLSRVCWEFVEEPEETSEVDETDESDDQVDESDDTDTSDTSDEEKALDTAIKETITIEEVPDEEPPVKPTDDDAPDVDLHAFLTANVGPIGDMIETGKFDDDLEKLHSIEKSTKGRKTVIRNIETRLDEING